MKLRKFKWSRKRALIVGIVLILFILGITSRNKPEALQATESREKQVEVQRISDITPTVTIKTIGEIESVEEVTVRARSSGIITRVNVKAGDRVERGQVIATLEALNEAATVAQAEAGVMSAQAALDKLRAGATSGERRLAELEVESAEGSLEIVRDQARDAIQNAYSAADIAIRTNIDPIFFFPRTNPELRFSVNSVRYGNLKGNLEGERREAEIELNELRMLLLDISNGADVSDIEDAQTIFTEFVGLADLAGLAVNSTATGDPELETWRAGVAQGRASINAGLTGLRSAQSALEGALQNAQITKEQLDIVKQGARSEDIRAAEAAVAAAKANLQFAQANLSKTQVVTPIGGTVNELFVDDGEAASLFAEVATIAENNVLQITAYVSPEEASRISVGTPVRINERSEGEVAFIGASIGSTGKIEIQTIVTEKSDDLINGDVAELTIETSEVLEEEDRSFLLPLSALKVSFDGEYVLTVEDGKAVRISVTSGDVRGSYVEIIEGLSEDARIIMDARGVEEGDEVVEQR